MTDDLRPDFDGPRRIVEMLVGAWAAAERLEAVERGLPEPSPHTEVADRDPALLATLGLLTLARRVRSEVPGLGGEATPPEPEPDLDDPALHPRLRHLLR